ncbi:MAG: hypothetical protein R3F59_22145 [Myxococcota bacterium]
MLALALALAPPAAAGVGGQLTAATTFVPGLHAGAAEVPTLSGAASAPPVWDPRLRVGLQGALQATLPHDTALVATWAVWRDQAFCDVCGDGAGPGWLGSELLGSSDATVALQRRFWLGDPPAGAATDAADLALQPGRATARVPWLSLRVDAVLPASRDALVCNPLVAAPGAGATFGLPAGRSTVQLGVSGSRPVYANRAAPVGRCAPPLQGQAAVPTLTGAVAPTPWDGARWGSPNTTLSGSASVAWVDPQALLPGAPERLFTSVAAGLAYSRAAADPAAEVAALSGAVAVDASANPVRVAVPWSVQAGWSATERLDLSLGLANRLPVLLADPGGALRAQPARTSVTAALAARF